MSLQVRFAEEILADPAVWVAGVLARTRSYIPALIRDDQAADLAAASSRALLEQFADALVTDSGTPTYDAPEAALRFCRYLARTDVPLSLLLRSYRLGQELLFSRAAELVDEGDMDGLRDVGLLTFRYVDSVVGEVTEAFEREREAVLRGSALRRERTVNRLLAGEGPPIGEVERLLGWRMSGPHLAAVGWTTEPESDGGALAASVRRVLDWSGDGNALIMPGPTGELYAWVRPAGVDLAVAPQELRECLTDARARVAFGDPGLDLAGFVASRRQADAARRVARYLPSRSVVVHAEVSLLNLLIADPVAAATFVTGELRHLAEEPYSDLRRTARAYLEHGQDTTAAAATLGVHRNTVMRRLARTNDLLGRDLVRRPTETLVALSLCEVGLGRHAHPVT